MDRYYLPQELQDLVEEKVKVLNNLAQAQMKLEAWESALASLKQVLKLEVSLRSKRCQQTGSFFCLFSRTTKRLCSGKLWLSRLWGSTKNRPGC